MGFRTGIIGLPNVGKSTLFNALTHTASAQNENYPFCTIEANLGEVPVNDSRLSEIAGFEKSKQIIQAKTTFVDIAGLVKGASKGEGLGNKFLGNIREVDALAHVVRCFDDNNIVHVDGQVDPLRDIETIETELMLADLESIEKQRSRLVRKIRGGDKESLKIDGLLELAQEKLEHGIHARPTGLDEEDTKLWHRLKLLTSKPFLYVCNVDENSLSDGNNYSAQVEEYARKHDASTVLVSAQIEEEISQLNAEEEQEYLTEMGLDRSGLDRLIQKGYSLLGLITYFTTGPNETRAWTIQKGTNAADAAAVIHEDFRRGFIRAETISFEEFISCGGYQLARQSGKIRTEGKTYKVKDGEILHFLFNV
ncbi:MAG: redox-regulated ATPase YchF [Rhodobacteraceae bacterium]|nr:redox-regulated ATPase YchF [Paracoccaceae bacterium]